MSIGTILAATLATAAPLAAAPAGASTCAIPGHRTVPVGSHVALSFGPGVSPSVQAEFRAAAASVAPLVDTGPRPFHVTVVSRPLKGHNRGISGVRNGAATTAIAPVIAGGTWTRSSLVTDFEGFSEYALTLVWHEFGHDLGLGHPGGDEIGPAQCPNLAGATKMFHHTRYDGPPGAYGPADLATLRRVYGGGRAGRGVPFVPAPPTPPVEPSTRSP